jgi:hypothetical protein
MSPTSEGGAVGKMLFMSGGLWVWAAHFTLIYGFTTVACAEGLGRATLLGPRLVPFAIGVATALAWAASGMLLWSALSLPVPPRSIQLEESSERLLRHVSIGIALLSLVAIAWNALPVLMLAPC